MAITSIVNISGTFLQTFQDYQLGAFNGQIGEVYYLVKYRFGNFHDLEVKSCLFREKN